jgi:hypothetical protein
VAVLATVEEEEEVVRARVVAAVEEEEEVERASSVVLASVERVLAIVEDCVVLASVDEE